MNGELILTDQELAMILSQELDNSNIVPNIESGSDNNTITYEMILTDEQIAGVVKSYLTRRNVELNISDVVFSEKAADQNKFTFTEEGEAIDG